MPDVGGSSRQSFTPGRNIASKDEKISFKLYINIYTQTYKCIKFALGR